MKAIHTPASLRARLAIAAADLATWASRTTGRGRGGMIGGLIAGAIDPNLLRTLGNKRPAVLVTGTNGKSTTTRMLAEILRREGGGVATNDGGDNMDAGIISALLAGRNAHRIVLEVDELHVPHIAEALDATMLVLLNLSRDQLDRVGEINTIERALRASINARPGMRIIANCDDVSVTSAAWDSPNVTWVSAGHGWIGDSTSCPRTGGAILHQTQDNGITDWYSTKKLPDGREFRRPEPQWRITDTGIIDPDGHLHPLNLALPGQANRGNATQAIAAAVTLRQTLTGMGAGEGSGAGNAAGCAAGASGVAGANSLDIAEAIHAAESVRDVAGRYSTVHYAGRNVRLMLAKNPAGWQEALAMVDRDAETLIISVNGQVADGQDLSWLWDVSFENLESLRVIAAGERGTDLAVRLGYAGVEHALMRGGAENVLQAIRSSAPGRVELLANYTAFRDVKRALDKAGASAAASTIGTATTANSTGKADSTTDSASAQENEER